MVDPCSQTQHHQHQPGHQQVVHVVERDRFDHKEHPEEVDSNEELQDEEAGQGHGEGQAGANDRREGTDQMAT